MTLVRRVSRSMSLVQLCVVGVLLALLLPAGLGSATATAQTPAQLVGIRGEARASGISAYYNLGGVLPIASPVDSSAPDAFTTIAGGPSTFARAAVYNPGDLLANPDVVFQLFDPSWEPGTIPPYPYRVEARSGFGEPKAESNPGPGLRASVETTPDGSAATASVGRSDAPSILTVGGVTTRSSTETDGSTVTVHAVTEVTDVDLFGALAIESIVTEVTATSDGSGTEVSGKTTVGGATLAGQKVAIDGDGIHPDEPKNDSLLGGVLKSLSGDVSELLSEAGITVTAGSVTEHDAGDVAEISATGLKIELDITGETAPLLGELFDVIDTLDLPHIEGAPLQIADVLELVRNRNIVRLEVAGAHASLAATAAPELPAFEPPEVAPTPPVTPAPPTASPAPATQPPPTSQSTTTTPVPEMAAPAPASDISVATLAPGIGAALVLALLAQPLLGLLLRSWVQRILSPAAAAGGPCSLEVPDG